MMPLITPFLKYKEMSDLIFNSVTNSPEFNYTGEPPLDNSSTYYWRIQALDENGNLVGSMSNVAFFSTPSVDEIELTSPLNITVPSLTPTFSWRTLENAVAYRISIVLDGEVIWNSEVENGETFYPGNPPLVYETTYFWNVQPIDVDGNDFLVLKGAKKVIKDPKLKSILIELATIRVSLKEKELFLNFCVENDVFLFFESNESKKEFKLYSKPLNIFSSELFI